MALYAFDGTWNDDEADEAKETNVLQFRKCLSPGTNAFYLEGVGTRLGFIGKLLGGVTGAGGHFRIHEAKQQLDQYFAQGDRRVDIIGFSRGAPWRCILPIRCRRSSLEPMSAFSGSGIQSPLSAFQGMT